MSLQALASAVQRAKAVYARKPSRALHDDSPAVAAWQGSQRCVCTHPNGSRILTDMPAEMGGRGDQVTPGWLFRAGLAACSATTWASRAADEGIELTLLEVRVESRSDSRGFLNMPDENGAPVNAQPCDLRMRVRIAATNRTRAELDAFLRRAQCCSPVPQAVVNATPLALDVEFA